MRKTIMLAIAVIAAGQGMAHAGPRYDRSLEEAAKMQLAQRIGDIESLLRGTFASDEAPAFSRAVPRKRNQAVSYQQTIWSYGLARAVDRNPVQPDRVVLTGSVVAVD